jgi:membrane protein required for colicin V production
MHYLDIIILIIIVASAVEGGIHGFVYELFSLGGLLLGLFLAWKYFSLAALYLQFTGLPAWLLNVIAFMLILILVGAILRMIGGALKKALHSTFMGSMDRVVGVVFGLLRGVIVVLLLTLILLLTPLSSVLTREAPRTRLLKPSIHLIRPMLDTLMKEGPHFHGHSPDAV